MKLNPKNPSLVYLIATICIFSYASLMAQESMQFTQSRSQSEEVNERMNLYKRIKLEKSKKELMQLLHDIAALQKQCKDKGYLCSSTGADMLPSLRLDTSQNTATADDAMVKDSLNRTHAPDIRLLGIVGNRARFRLEDGTIKDFSLDDVVVDLWKITKISADSTVLVYNQNPQRKARYQVYNDSYQDKNLNENDQ